MSRSFLSVADLSREEFENILTKGKTLKGQLRHPANPTKLSSLEKRIVGLLFEKPSTRTRTSFEVAVLKLRGDAVYLPSSELQLSRGEPIKDTARMLGGYLDCIVARVYANDTVVQLSKYSGLSVINALSDLEHPTQTICDLLTVMEAKGKLEGLKLAYIGDGNNVCNSLLLGCATVGMNMTVACPTGYNPDKAILQKANEIGRTNGARMNIVHKPKAAVEDADVLYADVWVSMGEEKERKKKMKAFRGYQINAELLRAAKADAVVMHCLPAHRGLEITDEVIESKRSIVWSQGENKLYGAAAILEFLLA